MNNYSDSNDLIFQRVWKTRWKMKGMYVAIGYLPAEI